jgi:hypothetical protein
MEKRRKGENRAFMRAAALERGQMGDGKGERGGRRRRRR